MSRFAGAIVKERLRGVIGVRLFSGITLGVGIGVSICLPQDQAFTARVVCLTLSEISEKGPSQETASFVSRSMGLFWPKRRELLKATTPHLSSPDPSKLTSAIEILYFYGATGR